MATANILVHNGEPSDNGIFQQEYLAGPDAIDDGYARFKEIIDVGADWLVSATVIRDFADNLLVDITMRSDEYMAKMQPEQAE